MILAISSGFIGLPSLWKTSLKDSFVMYPEFSVSKWWKAN